MKFILSAIFLAALTLCTFAQSPSKVLKQAEKALGGSKAIKSANSLTRNGRIKRLSDGAEGSYRYQTSRPNLFNASYDIDGFENELGYNGRSAWSRNSRDGLQTLTGKSSTDVQARALFRNNLWLNAKAERSRLTPAGQAVVDGKQTNVVILTTQKGAIIKLYFDTTTGLLARDEMPLGEDVETTDYSDYRDVNGLKQAFAMRVTSGNEAYEITLDAVALNPKVARAEFDFPQISGEALPDIPSLLKDLQANEDKVDSILDTYSFTQKTTKRELGKDGLLREKESETKQLSFYKGYRISRLIEKDGRPLTEEEQTDTDKDVAKQVAEIENKLAQNESREGRLDSTGKPSENSRRISVAEVLHASKLINPRRERFRGRECVVFDFEPNPEFDTRSAKSILRFFGKTAGVIWVDTADKQVARLEAVLLDSIKVGGGLLANFKKGATFVLEKDRINDEIWLPSQMDINFTARVLLFKGIDLNQVDRFYDYRKFETEVKDARVVEEKEP